MTTALEMVAPRVVALPACSSVRVARLALLGTPTARMLPVERSGRIIGVLYALDIAAPDVRPSERIMNFVRPVCTWVGPDTDRMKVYSTFMAGGVDLLVGDADNFRGQLTCASVLGTLPFSERASTSRALTTTALRDFARPPSPCEFCDSRQHCEPCASVAPVVRDAVLVVEDDEMTRALQLLVVEEAGLRPIGAATLEEAQAVLNESSLELALILLDVHLPDGNGVEFGGRVADGDWPDALGVPIMIVSATGDLDLLAAALEVGPIAHFRKPFQPLDLLEAVRAHAAPVPVAC